MSMILIGLLGSIINRIRGGGLTDLIRETKNLRIILTNLNLFSFKNEPLGKLLYVKPFHDFVFALTFTILFNLSLSQHYLFSFVILFLTVYGGRSMGWGGYISAMIEKRIDHSRDDVKILDMWFRGDDEPVLSGWAALSLRGFIWTSCIALGFVLVDSFINEGITFHLYQLYVALSGLLMGSCYLFSMKLAEIFLGKHMRGFGWKIGEIIFGFYLWASLACVLQFIRVLS